ncbi:MAG: type II secretion system GspH family protein [Firmicutes bacterium]|nr:type II secretion system GspH family protein [Bacillota bacterium]
MNNLKNGRIKGVTLTEVIIGLVILAILFAIIWPNYVKYRSTTALKGFCDDFTHAIKLAKETARSMEGSRVDFVRRQDDLTKNSYPIGYAYFQIKKPDGTVIRKISFPDNVTASGIPLTNYFEFKANGTVDTTLNIYLISSGCKTKGYMTINKDTGSIDMVYQEN